MYPMWHIIVFVSFIAKIHSVGIDYYSGGRDDVEPDDYKNEYVLPQVSRNNITIPPDDEATVKATNNQTNIRRHQSQYTNDSAEDDEYSDDEEYIDVLQTFDTNHSLRTNVSKKYPKYEEYLYFEDNATANIISTAFTPNPFGLANNTITTKLSLAGKFYNIKPNIIHLDKSRLSQDERVTKWYIPEKLRCQSDLPLLYGTLNFDNTGDKVFLIHEDSLANVTLSKATPKPKRRPLPSVATSRDRWCTIPPCYGDHSLCLFADDKLGELCEDGYKVVTPTAYEQMALTNTLNAMRNRVANGQALRYKHLGKAANMKRILYDRDLESMVTAWLRQCTPGPAHCVALEWNTVSQLECTKQARHCCHNRKYNRNCIPSRACFIPVILGCLHAWYESAGEDLEMRDVHCAHLEKRTYATAQILWAKTNRVGCAYGSGESGDVKVICNFAPGAPFVLERVSYCGIIPESDLFFYRYFSDITKHRFLTYLGIELEPWTDDDYTTKTKRSYLDVVHVKNSTADPYNFLYKAFKENWLRSKVEVDPNSTVMGVARLVSQYEFRENSQGKCDNEESIYIEGEPGSQCYETGKRFTALCYKYKDEGPGYRTVAVLAPVALFSLILYDLFSSVVRQTTY